MWNSAVEYVHFLHGPFKNRPFFRLLGVMLVFCYRDSEDEFRFAGLRFSVIARIAGWVKRRSAVIA